MRVLFLTGHLPYPPYSGGRRREFELVRRLAGDVAFDIVAVSKTPVEDRRYAGVLGEATVFEAAGSWNGEASPRLVQRHRCEGVVDYVHAQVQAGRFDLVHVEGFYLMQHVPDPCPVPVVLVEQNVEYTLWIQRAVHEADPVLRAAHLAELRHTWTAELDAWARSDLLAVLTEDDRREVLAASPNASVRIVPDGADHSDRRCGPEARKPLVVFVGNFGYEPNEDAALYLCDAIVPRLVERVPQARVLLVGNAPSEKLRARAARSEHVVVTGRVPEVEPFVDAAHVVVAPLRVGGGIKVKVLEALSRGRPIVATSVAAQGLGSSCGDCILIADEPEEFAARIVELLACEESRRRLALAAQSFASTLPSWNEAALSLLECYREVVAAPERLGLSA
jgi:polysaccharide biosynthesis protein PslH